MLYNIQELSLNKKNNFFYDFYRIDMKNIILELLLYEFL